MDPNRGEWARERIAAKYARREGLFPEEERWLAANGERFRGARILDLGVGCGRTTPHLLQLSSRYVGVDYSTAMVACAKRRFPAVDLRVGDARELEFGDGSFELVVFSFNGIDMVDRRDRGRVLREVHRVLVSQGTFFFSAHDLRRPPVSAYDPRQINFTPNPLRLSWRVLRWGLGIAHHLRRRRHQVRGDGWAILNDKANNYRLLTHYALPQVQAEELRASGFAIDEMIDGGKFMYFAASRVG